MTPLGLPKPAAAEYIGIGTTKFDELVQKGIMPQPKRIGTKPLWSRIELEQSFAELPTDGHNEWDEA